MGKREFSMIFRISLELIPNFVLPDLTEKMREYAIIKNPVISNCSSTSNSGKTTSNENCQSFLKIMIFGLAASSLLTFKAECTTYYRTSGAYVISVVSQFSAPFRCNE